MPLTARRTPPPAFGLPPHLVAVLNARGIHDTISLASFRDRSLSSLHHPLLFPDMENAVRILSDHLGAQPLVYGDYDVDGITGTSILLLALCDLACEAAYHIPHRTAGYGLNSASISALAPSASLFISVDCGIANLEQVANSPRPFIVTDHHQPRRPGVRPPTTVLHPLFGYPFPHLSGAGVAWKFATALLEHHNQEVSSPDLLALAAFGAVADVVPLVGENRIIVYQGLHAIPNCSNPGIRAILTIAGLADRSSIRAEDIAFQVAPRLNALGRLACASLGVELFLTPSSARATEIAAYADYLNRERRRLEKAATAQALASISPSDPAAVIVGHFPPGLVGVLAGKVAEKTGKPALVLHPSGAGLTGSGRSPTAPLHEALSRCTHLLSSHGGHAAAAGLSLPAANLDSFREAFFEAVGAAPSSSQEPAPDADAMVAPSVWSESDVETLEDFGPFGSGNPSPLFLFEGYPVGPRRMGSDGSHLSFLSPDGVRCVAFGQGDFPFRAGIRYQFLYRPVINEFRGRRSVEAQVRSISPC